MRGLPKGDRTSIIRAEAASRLTSTSHAARRRLVTGTVRVVELGLGPTSANRYFWRNPLGNQPWHDVEQRLDRLTRENPAHVADFVERSCQRATDPTALFGLARHPASADACRRWILDNIPSPAQADRLRRDRILGGAVAGAARLLLEGAAADSVTTWISDLYQITDPRSFEVTDSFGQPPTPGESSSSRRRLIVAEHADDRSMLGLLVPGAERVTVVSTADTFGQADLLDWSSWTGADDLIVEHIRTRITRFSTEYIELHGATAAIARTIARRVAERTGLVPDDLVPYLSVEIADFLFFQTLRLRAVERLLADDQFDQIIVALGNQRPGSEYFDLLANVEGLVDDPRVEFVSISRSAATRSRFWSQVDAVRGGGTSRPHKFSRAPDDVVLRGFHRLVEWFASEMPQFGPRDGRRVLLVTANNKAYNEPTASTIKTLDQEFDLRVAIIGPSAVGLSTELGEHDVGIDFGFLPVGPQHVPALTEYLRPLVGDVLGGCACDERSPEHRAVAVAANFAGERLVRQVIGPAIVRHHAIERWFRSMDDQSRGPEAVVLTPNRTVGVGSVSAIARRMGVPTLVLEPHVHDANYSRYLKIGADYYGVMSDYFRDQAVAGLGMSLDRTVVVGSARQVAPRAYEPAIERELARRRYRNVNGIDLADGTPALTFFCQPSDWDHVRATWTNVLEGARRSGWRVLLKTHPEESPSRVRQYLAVADELPGVERPVVLDSDAATAIALADAVATAYSTAGVDAALRSTPVIVATDGDVSYPVDLSRMLGAPVARSADDVTALLDSIRSDPGEWEQRARTLLDREPQFVEGPDRRLIELVDALIERGPEAVRPASEVPDELFLDPPHPVFPV